MKTSIGLILLSLLCLLSAIFMHQKAGSTLNFTDIEYIYYCSLLLVGIILSTIGACSLARW